MTGKPLTKQDSIFIKEVVSHGNKTHAAQKAYGIEDPNYAGVKANRMLRKDRIVNSVQKLADKISDEKLRKVLQEGLDATREDRPDYAVRHKYLDTALKLKGAYAEDSKPTNIFIPVLVKFLDKDDKENTGDSDRDSDRVQETL